MVLTDSKQQRDREARGDRQANSRKQVHTRHQSSQCPMLVFSTFGNTRNTLLLLIDTQSWVFLSQKPKLTKTLAITVRKNHSFETLQR